MYSASEITKKTSNVPSVVVLSSAENDELGKKERMCKTK